MDEKLTRWEQVAARGSGTEGPTWNTDRAYLRVGLIPSYCRVYDDGVETWPGNGGMIPADWDGVYPDNAAIPRGSGRGRRSSRGR